MLVIYSTELLIESSEKEQSADGHDLEFTNRTKHAKPSKKFSWHGRLRREVEFRRRSDKIRKNFFRTKKFENSPEQNLGFSKVVANGSLKIRIATS